MQKKAEQKNFWKSRKTQVGIIMFIAIALTALLTFLQVKLGNESLSLEIICYSAQIISSLFVTASVIIAVWQYYLSAQSAKTDLEVIQVQRAIDLSEYYKDNILNLFPAVYYVYNKTGITSILNSVRLKQMDDFDSAELSDLFSQKQIKKLNDIQNSDEFFECVLEANSIYNLGLKIAPIERTITAPNGEIKNIKGLDPNVTLVFFSNYIDNLLNNMEFFALHFSHKTADESVVYQSLHQSYLEIVSHMYYTIARKNTDATSKFYTNVIWLFQEWKTKKTEKQKEHAKASRSIESKGTIIKI